VTSIRVLSPLGTNRVDARPITPRLGSLDGVTVGILKHSAFIPTFGTSKSVTRTIDV
jgi:hypothetical protein